MEVWGGGDYIKALMAGLEGEKIFILCLQNVLLENDFNWLLVALIRWCIKPEQNSSLLTMWGKWVGKLNGERRVREQSLPCSCHRAVLPLTSLLRQLALKVIHMLLNFTSLIGI